MLVCHGFQCAGIDIRFILALKHPDEDVCDVVAGTLRNMVPSGVLPFYGKTSTLQF